MNPTIAREINLSGRNRLRNEAQTIMKEVEDKTMKE